MSYFLIYFSICYCHFNRASVCWCCKAVHKRTKISISNDSSCFERWLYNTINTPLCSWRYRTVDNISVYVIPRTYFIKILKKCLFVTYIDKCVINTLAYEVIFSKFYVVKLTTWSLANRYVNFMTNVNWYYIIEPYKEDI